MDGDQATELGRPLLKRGVADAQLLAGFQDWEAKPNTIQNSHDLAIRKSRVIHLEIHF